jgi:hypothetical protein
MAFKSARKIGSQKLTANNTDLDLEIVISINNVESIPSDINISFTQISHIPTFLGGDANIAKGFVTALEKRPDYFWILSANEELTEEAISNLLSVIYENPSADLIIANAAGRHGKLEISNVFLDCPPKLALGLISGVIYKFDTTKNSFLQSTLFSWTGWGQLSVIQDILSRNKTLNLVEIPDSFLYGKPYTFLLDAEPGDTEMEIVRNLYAHSFYGLPILAYCLWQNEKKNLKRFQSEWLRFNWYKLNAFSRNSTSGDELKLQRIEWIKSLSEQTFKSSFHLRIIYLLSSKIATGRLINNSIAIRALSLYKRYI